MRPISGWKWRDCGRPCLTCLVDRNHQANKSAASSQAPSDRRRALAESRGGDRRRRRRRRKHAGEQVALSLEPIGSLAVQRQSSHCAASPMGGSRLQVDTHLRWRSHSVSAPSSRKQLGRLDTRSPIGVGGMSGLGRPASRCAELAVGGVRADGRADGRTDGRVAQASAPAARLGSLEPVEPQDLFSAAIAA